MEAIRLDPNNSWAYIVRGSARIDQKDPAAGIADITVAIRLDPGNSYAWANRAWGYRMRGQYHQAAADATEAIRLRPGFDTGLDMRGTCYAKLGEYRKSLADYEALARSHPTNARWRMICATLRATLGDPDGARKDREEALKLDPNQGDEPLLPVIPPIKKDPEIELPPIAGSDRSRLAGLLARGETLVKFGRQVELDTIADEALKIDPESPRALALRATYRSDRNDWAGASRDVDEALRLNPETYQAWIVRAHRRIQLADGSPDDCIADLTIAARLRPTEPLPLSNRALMYLAKKEYPQAIADASGAIKLGQRGTGRGRPGPGRTRSWESTKRLWPTMPRRSKSIRPTRGRSFSGPPCMRRWESKKRPMPTG